MKARAKTISKWILRGFLFLFLIEGLHITALAFPFPLFSHKGSFAEFTVYSRNPIPEGFEQTIDDTRSRVAAMDHTHPGANIRVYLCDSQEFYSVFTFLVRKGSNSLGFGLSIFDNIYLNETKIRRMAEQNNAGIRNSRFEGNYAEVIAHEIAHFNLVDELGYRAAMRVPFWKAEGYAEYQANIAAVRTDPEYDFLDRIALLRDSRFWAGNESARCLFEWHLLVEYLIDVEEYDLYGLIDEVVTEPSARARMFAWYGEQRSSG